MYVNMMVHWAYRERRRRRREGRKSTYLYHSARYLTQSREELLHCFFTDISLSGRHIQAVGEQLAHWAECFTSQELTRIWRRDCKKQRLPKAYNFVSKCGWSIDQPNSPPVKRISRNLHRYIEFLGDKSESSPSIAEPHLPRSDWKSSWRSHSRNYDQIWE